MTQKGSDQAQSAQADPVSAPAPAPAPSRPMPVFPLPRARLLLVTLGATVVVAGIGWPLADLFQRGAGVAAAIGAGVGGLGCALGILAVKPWKPRAADRWGAMLMGAHGLAMLCVILLSVGLYSATQPALTGFVPGVVAAYVLSQIAQATVYGSEAKRSFKPAGG